MKRVFSSLFKTITKRTKAGSVAKALAVLVVFVTTYVLILPAFTLERDEAARQGGIDIPAVEAAAEEVSGRDAEPGDDAAKTAKEEAWSDENAEDEASNVTAAKSASQTDPLTFEGAGFTVAVDDAKSVLPENTEVVASELLEKPAEGTKAEKKEAEEAYKKYYELAQQTIKDEDGADNSRAISFVKFYDISLQAAGETVQPDKPVNVTISYDKDQQKDLKVDEKKNVKIIHFTENLESGEITAELLKKDAVEVSLEKKQMAETTFEAESFSVYGVVYTVDFSYEVDGKSYEYSIKGGEGIGLSELLPVLGVIKDDKDTDLDEVGEFIGQIEDVKFSDAELVWFGKADKDTTVGALKEANGLKTEYSAELTEEQIAEIDKQTVKAGDWALISLKPFDTEETLTVNMKNGDKFVVKVTDAQKPYKDVDSLENGNYIIFRSDNSNSRYMFMKNDGTTSIKRPANGEALNANDFSSYTWTVTKNGDGTYTIKSTNSNRYISLTEGKKEQDKWSKTSGTPIAITLSGHDGITISHNNYVLKRNDNGFYYDTGTGVGLTFYKIEDDPSGSPSHDTGIELTDEERAELEKWEETIEKFNTLTDYNKTAEAFDYDNRIYKIDIEADSGIMDFYKDVDLGFVLDVSNSMKFPSSLKAAEDPQGNDFKVWMNEDALNSAYWAYQDYYNRQGCFYILSDPALTSTIYRVFWNGQRWQYQDASSNDPSKIYDINDGTTFKEPFRQSYTLYYADDQIQRIDYLNNSVAQAVETLKKIVQPTEGTDDETANVRIAYNFFAGTKSSNGVITQYAIRGSHDFVDLRSQESRTFEVKPKGNEADGTRQDLALYDSNNDPNLGANEFSWNSDSNVDRYVILVTDGAPNGASMAEVEAAARRLKTEDHVKLITIGLSTKDVDGGSTLLKNIADDVDGDGVKDFYEAEKASDLKHILSKILQTIMAKGLVRGTVTDTIDKGFYPVDSQGNPLSAGVYNSNGQLIPNARISDYVSNGKATAAHQNEAFYTWEQVGDEWKITWYNQEIGWDDNDTSTGNPWTGTVYVKAKEDYLGGNLIETNDGNATIEPTGLKLVINGSPESAWRPLEGMTPIELPVPRVNVHNLETKENNTTWTVYKGTKVGPKEQLEALWDVIPIEEVVSESEGGQHKRTTGSSANIGIPGKGETFTLGSLMSEVAPDFNIDSMIDQVTASNASASQEFTYSAYGHESGKITVKVERTAGTQPPVEHIAETVGTPIEQYKVTFTYKPYTEAERMEGKVKDPSDTDHHNGLNGRGAEETGKIKSENTHTINVIKRIATIKKTDTAGRVIDDGEATFTISHGSDSITAHTTNGIYTWDYVVPDEDQKVPGAYWADETAYSITETAPPNGYAALSGAIPVTLKITDVKTQLPAADNTHKIPYNWTQSASLIAASTDNVTVSGDGDITISVKNEKYGSLKISKNVKVPAGLSAGLADGTYTFEIWNAENTSQITKKADGTDIGPLQLTISDGVAAELTVDKLKPGTYIVKETGSTNDATIIDTSDGGYSSSLGGILVTVSEGDEGGIKTAEFTNKYETTEASVKKVWRGDTDADRPSSLTVVLLENGKATSRTVTLTSANGWEGEIKNLPKYKNGEEIDYHWAESDIPAGYFLTNYAEEGTVTTLTNTLSTYDLKTSYTGIKTWVDESNKYSTRPPELIITLFADNVAQTNVPVWNYNYAANQWSYTFENLPVFDENGSIIHYTVEETVPNGYSLTETARTPTTGSIGTITYQEGNGRNTPDNKLTWNLGSFIDLSFVAIKPTSAGAVVVWTHRIPTPAEKTAIQNLLKNNALPGCKDRDVVWYSGVSADMETPHGLIHITYDESELEVTLKFDSPDEWSQFIWGQFNKNNSSSYDIGTTAFTNSIETTTLSGTKTWSIDGDDIPADPILTLTRTYKITEGEGDDATETTSAPEVVKVADENLQPKWSGSGKTKTFTYGGLPKYAPNGSEYTYSVAEASFTVGSGDDAVTYTAVKGENGTYTVTADKEGAEVFAVSQSGNDIVNGSVKASIEIIKVEKGHKDTDHTLNGAKFQLTRVNYADDYDATGADAYKSEIQTVEDGITSFTDLKPGRYKLEEKEAPAGYILTESQWFITIDNSGTATLTAGYEMASENVSSSNSFFIENEPGAELPHTGGIGTTIFYILGAALTLVSAVTLWKRRRTA